MINRKTYNWAAWSHTVLCGDYLWWLTNLRLKSLPQYQNKVHHLKRNKNKFEIFILQRTSINSEEIFNLFIRLNIAYWPVRKSRRTDSFISCYNREHLLRGAFDDASCSSNWILTLDRSNKYFFLFPSLWSISAKPFFIKCQGHSWPLPMRSKILHVSHHIFAIVVLSQIVDYFGQK